jgi:hypothetical protein
MKTVLMALAFAVSIGVLSLVVWVAVTHARFLWNALAAGKITRPIVRVKDADPESPNHYYRRRERPVAYWLTVCLSVAILLLYVLWALMGLGALAKLVSEF